MRLFNTNIFSTWFKPKQLTKQHLSARVVNNSNVYQAAGDMNIIQFPEEILKKLKEMTSKEFNIDGPQTIEPKDDLSLDVDEANELYVKLMESKIRDLNSLLDNGEIANSEMIISELMGTSGFDNIESNYKIQFFYFMGLISLEKDNTKESLYYLTKIQEIESKNKSYYILKSRIALKDQNSMMFIEAIQGLREIGHDNNDILIREMNYELTQGNTEIIINAFTELDVVKPEFESNSDALYYLGAAYLNENRFIDAKKNLIKSDSLKKSKYKKFLVILTQIIPILQQPGIIYLISKEDTAIIKRCLNELLKLSDYFLEKTIVIKAEFWAYVLNLKLLLNPSEIIADTEKFPEDLRSNEKIQLMIAEAFSLIGEENHANEIYQALYQKEKKPQLLIKILKRYYVQNEFCEIINILEGIEDSEYDEEGNIAGLYLASYSKFNDFEKTTLKFEEFREKFPEAIMLYTDFSVVAFEQNDLGLAKSLMEKAISLISEEYYPVRFYIAEICESIGLIEEAIEVLRPLELHNVKASEIMVRLLLICEEPTKNEIAEQITNRLIQTGNANLNILYAKAETVLRQDNISAALEPLINAFQLTPNMYSAYNIVAVKLQLQQKEGFDEYITFLKNSSNPKAIMLAAVALDYLNNKGTAEELAYIALISLGSEFDETVYMQYIMFYMQRGNRARRDEVVIDFNNVERDTVITLVDDAGLQKYICINSEINLEEFEGLGAFGCDHYKHDSATAIKLLRLELNETVELDGIEYLIVSITNKRIYAFRYCLEKYTELCSQSSLIKSININPNDPASSLLPFLSDGRRSHEFLLRNYNFENSIGLPISAICDKDYSKYPEALLSLFNKQEQIFYAGEPNGVYINNQKIVLSISSLILLKTLNLLDKLDIISDKIYVAESLYISMKNIFLNVSENEVNVSGSIGLTDEGLLLYIPTSDEQKQAKVNYWRDILLFLEKVNKVPVIAEKMNDLNTSPIMNEFEMDTIEAGKQLEAIIICDDLFLRKITNKLIGEGKTINSVILLLSISNENEMLDTILFLSKVNYLYCFNAFVMCSLIERLVTGIYLVGPGTRHEKLMQIIKNVLAYPFLFEEYLPILNQVIYGLYDKRYDQNIDLIIREIIKEIKNAARLYAIPSTFVVNYLRLLAGIDLKKASYITNIFNL